MDGAPRSRATVALAVAAIVAAVALLVAGAVLAPSGEARIEDEVEPAEESASAPAVSPTTTTTTEKHAGHDAEVAAVAGEPIGPVEAHEAHEAASHAVASHDVATSHEVVTPHDVASHDLATPGTTVVGHVEHVDHVTPTTTTPASTPITSLDDARLTASQRAAAQDLLDRTTAALAALATVDAVVGAGYSPVGDVVAGYQHYVADPYLDDGFELDADHIESILVHDGAVVAATFLLTPGSTLADAPDIAGELTPWRDHDGRCWEGERVVAMARADGSCARGQVRVGAPRLQVWLAPTPCGPFGAMDCAT